MVRKKNGFDAPTTCCSLYPGNNRKCKKYERIPFTALCDHGLLKVKCPFHYTRHPSVNTYKTAYRTNESSGNQRKVHQQAVIVIFRPPSEPVVVGHKTAAILSSAALKCVWLRGSIVCVRAAGHAGRCPLPAPVAHQRVM